MQYHDNELNKLWPHLRTRISRFFEGIVIEPALLHGDLWSGNVGENEEGPGIVIASFDYAHVLNGCGTC